MSNNDDHSGALAQPAATHIMRLEIGDEDVGNAIDVLRTMMNDDAPDRTTRHLRYRAAVALLDRVIPKLQAVAVKTESTMKFDMDPAMQQLMQQFLNEYGKASDDDNS